MTRIVGTVGDDLLDGQGGNDQIYGRGGNDTIHGYLGNDRINAGSGYDVVDGGPGRDLIHGGAGGDWLTGDTNNDWTLGGGADRIYGDGGNDSIYGQDGNDTLAGGVGDDGIWDDQGQNRMFGGAGNDFVGGTGLLSGGGGDDWLQPSAFGQNDRMYGGGDADTFNVNFAVLDGNAQRITIEDFRPGEGDRLAITSGSIDADGLMYDLSNGALFDSYDTNRDGQIRGDGSDAFSIQQGSALVLENWEDTLILRDVDYINASDWNF